MMRLNQKIKIAGILLIGSLAAIGVSAQGTFKYKAQVDKVDSDGFYKISLRPGIVAKSKADLSDIRLVDTRGNTVPYITRKALPLVEKQKFIVFPQAYAGASNDTSTSFIIENILKLPIRTIWLKLNNMAVQRTVNLTGSDDLRQWYAIEENIPLRDAIADSSGTYMQALSFPVTGYHYIKLLINDRNKAPLKFLQAGVYLRDSKDTAGFNWPVQSPQIIKKDSNKITYVSLLLNGNYQVNLLRLTIKAPKFYNREVTIFAGNGLNLEFIGNAQLNSNRPLNISLSVKTSRLELQIANKDDQPLYINNINVYQADEFIISYLEKGKFYQLLTGNHSAEQPQYDLNFFADSIKNIRSIGVAEPIYNGVPAINKTKRNYAVYIWMAIITALVLLSLLTAKMVQEVNKKNEIN